ncbi:PKD domain-containing protein [Sulfidibacter corallicola]|uniref:PKD domain-containing protein n=1 Tax=Sulfidibacter corallicola TaxID=2818388 RepID=A0A8A4TLZ3_SULCO|nr:Ig-like domain-containing protein [Sulfidibacter corallicola]QTD50976.1 PKD domain-containing protein [Sulfidibacter corallicola]
MNPLPHGYRARLRHTPTLLIALMLLGCASGTPELDENSTLRLSVAPAKIGNMGEAAQVTVFATNAGGRPAFDGTAVTLVATGGTLTEQVVLQNGSATATFYSDAAIGTVTVTAISGAAGLDQSVQAEIEIVDHRAPLGEVRISAGPSQIPATGGIVSLRIQVRGASGQALPGEEVWISCDRGWLTSGNFSQKTNAAGEISDTLHLTGPYAEDIEKATLTVQVRDQTNTTEIAISGNRSPEAMMSVSAEKVVVGQPIFVDGSASHDPDGTLAPGDFRWHFGDGTEARGVTARHTYSQPGSYPILLKVADELDAEDSATATVVVEAETPNTPPTAQFSFSPGAPRSGEAVHFNASASADEDGTVASYHWDFGDGQAVTTEDPRISHVFTDAATYVVNLAVTDDQGARTAAEPLNLEVAGNQRPTAVLTAAPATVKPGAEVVIDGSASHDADGHLVNYRFDMGDGTRRTGGQSTWRHRYEEPGHYPILLTVIDDQGAASLATAEVTVAEIEPPTALIEMDPASGAIAGQPVIFSGRGSSSDNGALTHFHWSFGDGGAGNGPEIYHVFHQPGIYPVSLMVVDSSQASDKTLVRVEVLPPP